MNEPPLRILPTRAGIQYEIQMAMPRSVKVEVFDVPGVPAFVVLLREPWWRRWLVVPRLLDERRAATVAALIRPAHVGFMVQSTRADRRVRELP